MTICLAQKLRPTTMREVIVTTIGTTCLFSWNARRLMLIVDSIRS